MDNDRSTASAHRVGAAVYKSAGDEGRALQTAARTAAPAQTPARRTFALRLLRLGYGRE
jgi:hypothetical protein